MVLAVFFAPGAQPAQAQTTIWSATLTVTDTAGGGQTLGCENPTAGRSCSSTSVLTDDDFTYGGVQYEVVWIRLFTNSGFLQFQLNKAIPADLKAALTLHVGSSQFPLAIAALTESGKRASWGSTGLTWSVGDTVSLSLVEPPPKPTVSLSASPSMVDEGSPVTITATLSEGLSSRVTIPLVITDGSAEVGDHGALRSITISAGETAGTGTIATRQDADTRDETFTVSLGTVPPELAAGSPSSVEITIRDDDVRVPSVPRIPIDDSQQLPAHQRGPYCYVGAGNSETEYVRYPDGRIVETERQSDAIRSMFACD